MRKINVAKKITDPKGKPMTMEFPIPKLTDTIVREIAACEFSFTDDFAKRFKSWQEKLRSNEKEDITIRDHLTILLSNRFVLQSNTEATWVSQILHDLSDTKLKELELSENKFQFLKRILEANKIKIDERTPNGIQEKEKELFFPYELGQLLEVFEEEEQKNDERNKK